MPSVIARPLHEAKRSLVRRMNRSPMRRVLAELHRRGVPLNQLDALEFFGGTGAWHTLDYASEVATLEVWEHDEDRVRQCRQNLPAARIAQVDSYAAMRVTDRKFDLIVVDNPVCVFDGHCENFDVFPAVLRLVPEDGILVLNVLPSVDPRERKRSPWILDEAHQARRRSFFRVKEAEQIPLPAIVATYLDLMRNYGFEVPWHLLQRRSSVYYLVLRLRRNRSLSAIAS